MEPGIPWRFAYRFRFAAALPLLLGCCSAPAPSQTSNRRNRDRCGAVVAAHRHGQTSRPGLGPGTGGSVPLHPAGLAPLGFVSAEAPGRFRFDTVLPANSNQGHAFPRTPLAPEQRLAVVEFLKDPLRFDAAGLR